MAVTQGCFPLKPVAVKYGENRQPETSTILNLEVLNDSSLKRLRSVLYNKETTQEVICETYKKWASNHQYLLFEQKRHRCPVRQIASLVPKRGNAKYAWKVRKQWREITLPFEYQKKLDLETGHITKISETTTNVLFLSLTWDVNFCDWKTAWDSISYFWNLFVANLRRKYGHVLTARVYESTEKGFPHIHCILYFPDYEFSTFLKWSNKKKRHIWRIPFPEVEKLRGFWHSFIDVQGMINLADGLKYLGKYISKGTDLECDDRSGKGLVTLANTWAFRKRSYSLGVKFKEAIFQKYLSLDLTHMSLTQTVSEQMTLDGKLLRDCQPSFLKPFFEKWTMRGIMEKSDLKRHGGIPKAQFSFGLCDSQKIFALWLFNNEEIL
ncbi:MAG: hypothetical protein NWF00_11990 [Candidatus Bathyarchaeota archaeon]|nr:hypothetical protein [Candidatus Bathyarchaeota archaeon]